MLAVLGLHAVLALALPLLARRAGTSVFLLAALAPGVAFGWLLTRGAAVLDGEVLREAVPWAPALDVTLDLRLDALSWVVALVVTGVGAAVFVYARDYFAESPHALGLTSSMLVAFAGSMLALVLSDSVVGLYVFWELTTLCSFLLIGGVGTEREERRAAVRALLVTTAGGFALLLGVLLLGREAGTLSLTGIAEDRPTTAVAAAGAVLVLVGAFAKSAQAPLHAWLPAAMVAPTPISAYLHAAAMVKAGVYLIAALAPAFAELLPWRPLVLVVGLATMALGGWRALGQTDLKRLLAYGTISQLGFLTVLLGAGTRTAAVAGLTLLLAHALFKSTLFLVVGLVDHGAGTRDLRELSGLRQRAPGLAALAVLAGASMAGLPPFLGFVGKEAAYEAFVEPYPGGALVLAGVVGGSVLTAAYTLRFLWGAFADRPGVSTDWHAPARTALLPGALLAGGGLALGLVPHSVDGVVAAYADAYAVEGERYSLELWHGLTPVLGLTVLTLLLGVGLHLARGPLAGWHGRLPVAAEDAEDSLARGTQTLAGAFTARAQAGSLPLYVATVLVTVALVPGYALVTGWPSGQASLAGVLPPRWWDSPVQGAVAAAVVAASVAVVAARRRLAAVLVLGAVGYLVAGLFVLHGAPDLALTQVLVESLTLVVFVLVTRRMPRDLPVSGPRIQLTRAVIAVAFGTFMGAASLATSAAHAESRVDEELFALTKESGGKNVVNVVLVEVRAMDTLGEVTVLAVAATGVASLVLVSRRTGGAGGESRSESPSAEPAAAEPAGVEPGEASA